MGLTQRWVPGNRWDLLDGRHPSPLPAVSVIVVHFEQHGPLQRTLHALARQDYPPELVQVIVTDDGSRRPPAVPDGVVLVRQADEGFRAAAARNLGAARATGEVLCFLDADTTPEPRYVRRMTRLPALLPDAVTVGRRRHADLNGVPADAPVEDAAPARALAEPGWLADAYVRTRDLLDADDRSYRYILSSVLACSRAFFDELGGFDESFTRYGGEDWEWAHRAWQAGAVFAHVPDAIAWHDGPDWAGRGGADDKNAETLQLARLIPVAGSRGRGLRLGAPDIVVRVGTGFTEAAVFVCVDSLLEALPHSRIVLDDPSVGSLLAGDDRVGSDLEPNARVVARVIRPFALLGDSGAELALLIHDLGSGERGELVVVAADGRPVLTATARRAVYRRERWGTDAAFRTEHVRLNGAVALRAEPDVEAYLGGWADASSLGKGG